jgi:hypothetical protein
MSYPTVRSDPYKKGIKKRRRRKCYLWPEEWWKKLCKMAIFEAGPVTESGKYRVSKVKIKPLCNAMIADFNAMLEDTEEA